MKRKLLALFVIGTLTFGLAGCSASSSDTQSSNSPSESATSSNAAATSQTDGADSSNSSAEASPDENGYVFALSPSQQQLYDSYTSSLDINTLSGASPIDVAKIYVQCGIDGNVDAEFGLYSPEGLTETKDEYIANTSQAVGDKEALQESANTTFDDIDSGNFINDTDTSGHIEYSNGNGDVSDFYMFQNADGIWQVKFFPFSQDVYDPNAGTVSVENSDGTIDNFTVNTDGSITPQK